MALKKRHPRFVVPNYGAKHRARVKDRWRKQRGTDNKKRRKYSGYGALPGIGYKNSDSVRFSRPDGSIEMLVHNDGELIKAIEAGYAIRFSHSISARKRMAMQRIADAKAAKIVNRVNR
ncbi:MAG: eL32 family ribosomal protein [Candidatus Micrarchaeia archaeon]